MVSGEGFSDSAGVGPATPGQILLAPAPAPTVEELLAIALADKRSAEAETARLKKTLKRLVLSSPAKAMRKKILAEYPSLAEDTAAVAILDSTLKQWDLLKEAERDIAERGLMPKDRFGHPKKNESADLAIKFHARYCAGMKQLNLDLEPLRESPGRPAGD